MSTYRRCGSTGSYREFGLTRDAFDRRFTRPARLRDRAAAGEIDGTLRRA